MMTYIPIEKPDDTEHKNKYKEGGGESGTAKRITLVPFSLMVKLFLVGLKIDIQADHRRALSNL